MQRILKQSKRIRARDAGIDLAKTYEVSEALRLIKERANSKFDETIEVVFACSLDARRGDQNIRGMVALPAGTGRSVRVAVFAEGEQADQARSAGAELVGGTELVDKVLADKDIDCDLCIATPSMMAHLSKLGRILGPKQLMPNPKLGTVTAQVAAAVVLAKKGQASLRSEKQGIVHTIVGKASFDLDALKSNFQAVYEGLMSMKPDAIKGNLVKKAYISSTMGFSLPIDLAKGLS
jgi:large subunit ribosomal protein L1